MHHARTMGPTNDSYNHRRCPRALAEHPTAFSVNRQTQPSSAPCPTWRFHRTFHPVQYVSHIPFYHPTADY
jgi:hypothetical protein